MADPKQIADALAQDQLLAQFNRGEGQAQPWYMKPMDMEGRATFLPFKDTLPGSVMNQRELALPGLLAGAVNAFTAPGRVSTQGFDAPEEAQNLAMNVMGGGITTGKMMRNPTGVGGTDLALNVYHGTPHEIQGKFDLGRVGSGEGNQSYGHGIYFAEAKPVAEKYRENLSSHLPSTISTNTEKVTLPAWAIDRVEKEGIDPIIAEWTQRAAEQRANALKSNQPWIPEANAARFEQELASLQKIKESNNVNITKAGNLYKADIPDAAIPMMLDWDKPVSKELLARITPKNLGLKVKQFDDGLGYVTDAGVLVTKVKQGKAKEVTEEMLKNSFNDSLNRYSTSGQNLYGWLVPGNAPEASQILSNAGITGIKYLDELSRTSGKGTSNFVVFKPETVDILERNGIPTRKELLQQEFDKLDK